MFNSYENKFAQIEPKPQRHIRCAYVLISFFYLFYSFINTVMAPKVLSNLIFPLNSLYMADKLLFPNCILNSELSKVVISPVNFFFIFPPGIFILSKILGNVNHIFIFLFLIQLFVPILIFRLLHPVSSVTAALLASFVSIVYFIKSDWWAPDWIIQPIMIIAVLVLNSINEEKNTANVFKLAALGLLAGAIMIFKHNIGFTFIILCTTVYFFRSLKISNNKNVIRPILYVIFTIYLLFGLIFFSKVMYFDNFVFYLLFYFLFWGAVIYFVCKNPALDLDLPIFLRNVSIVLLFFLILPLLVFFWFGGVIGYSRYWYSLFGMGVKYLPFWEYGFAGVIKNYSCFEDIKSLKINYISSVNLILFLFPFIVNCFIVFKLYNLMRRKTMSSIEIKSLLEVASIGIMGVFIFFPLEGYHILVTKLFIFLFAIFCFLKKLNKSFVYIKIILVILIAAVLANFLIKLPLKLKEITSGASSSKEMPQVIGLAVEKKVAKELNRQVDVIIRSVKGNPYYVIDSTAATLTSLMAIVDNKYPQYYLDMVKEIMGQEVADEIIASISQLPFVLVNYNDYRKYLFNQQDDQHMSRILEFVYKNFEEVDHYEAPENQWSYSSQILSFLIMRNRSNYKDNL